MEVLVLILVGIVTVGGLYRIVWDEIRRSRWVDKVAQESIAEADAEFPVIPIQQEATDVQIRPDCRTISDTAVLHLEDEPLVKPVVIAALEELTGADRAQDSGNRGRS